MTTKKVIELLQAHGVYPTTLTKRNGEFIFRRQYFHHMGKTCFDWANKIQEAIPGCQILLAEEIYKPFRRDTSAGDSSHFHIRFTIKEKRP